MTEKDPAVAQRQFYCKHSFIRSYGQTTCVHCGISQAELEAQQAAMSLNNFPFPGGIIP